MDRRGVTGYVSRREFHNAAMRKGFAYLPENDCFTCMKGHHLNFEALVYKKTSQGYYRVYSNLRNTNRKGAMSPPKAFSSDPKSYVFHLLLQTVCTRSISLRRSCAGDIP